MSKENTRPVGSTLQRGTVRGRRELRAVEAKGLSETVDEVPARGTGPTVGAPRRGGRRRPLVDRCGVPGRRSLRRRHTKGRPASRPVKAEYGKTYPLPNTTHLKFM